MRLWHQALIPKLPRAQLLGQHRECCALRGNGWGKKHSTVDYVFKYPYAKLVAYHYLVMDEMKRRGYAPDAVWLIPSYRGKLCAQCDVNQSYVNDEWFHSELQNIYPEHNDAYLQECIDNLRAKGVEIE